MKIGNMTWKGNICSVLEQGVTIFRGAASDVSFTRCFFPMERDEGAKTCDTVIMSATTDDGRLSLRWDTKEGVVHYQHIDLTRGFFPIREIATHLRADAFPFLHGIRPQTGHLLTVVEQAYETLRGMRRERYAVGRGAYTEDAGDQRVRDALGPYAMSDMLSLLGREEERRILVSREMDERRKFLDDLCRQQKFSVIYGCYGDSIEDVISRLKECIRDCETYLRGYEGVTGLFRRWFVRDIPLSLRRHLRGKWKFSQSFLQRLHQDCLLCRDLLYSAEAKEFNGYIAPDPEVTRFLEAANMDMYEARERLLRMTEALAYPVYDALVMAGDRREQVERSLAAYGWRGGELDMDGALFAAAGKHDVTLPVALPDRPAVLPESISDLWKKCFSCRIPPVFCLDGWKDEDVRLLLSEEGLAALVATGCQIVIFTGGHPCGEINRSFPRVLMHG